MPTGRLGLWKSSVSHTDAASTAGASTPRWELHNPHPKGERGAQREGRAEREGRRREKGGQAQDDRTDIGGHHESTIETDQINKNTPKHN